MKAAKKIIICTLLGVLLQNLIFLYVEKIYLGGESNYNIQKVDNTANSKSLKTNISENAEDIRTSYDGKYISYMDNGKLIVCNYKDESKNEYKEASGKIEYYKWLTDCNKIIVIEKMIENGDTYFVPISYDAKTNKINELTDFDRNEVKIKSSSLGAKVVSVAFSTVSSSLYMNIEEDGMNNLYYANQMNQIEKVRSNENIGNIAVPTTSSNVIMEESNKIFDLSKNNNLEIPSENNPRILGADKDDKVYLYNDNNGKTDTIYYANLSEKSYRWNEIKLKSEEDIKNIFLDYSGKIYINNPSKKTANEIISGKEIKYEGDLIGSYSEGVISKNGNEIIKNDLE